MREATGVIAVLATIPPGLNVFAPAIVRAVLDAYPKLIPESTGHD